MADVSERSIFLSALDKETSGEREAFLARACAGNPRLRAEIDELLRASDLPGNLLDSAPPGVGGLRRSLEGAQSTVALGQEVSKGSERSLPDCPGAWIGAYKLMEQIGEGGFGLVFVAEQHKPVHRKVALKVLKPGMDTREIIARFEAERQALALMDHPNIARVYDAGETATGRPYFVMELVRGIPISAFCDQSHMALRDRLELFIHVCQAVQHAHQKGIIHRDLKPSNVLVTLHDGTPVVKVIDFGIAKAIGQHLTDKTIYTRYAQMIGTPLYMSPEQALFSGLDVDTRSDIYSLGVLLYELLTGMTPFDRQRMETASFDEIRRIIREEEPPRLSTRLTTVDHAASTLSARRGTEQKKISALVRTDLDWIVMKALEKDRTRRYETASAFAADLRRFLDDEPIEARPPSTLYRFRKLARRHKVALTTGSLVVAALVLGTGVSAWQAVRATRAQAEADDSRKQTEEFAERLKSANVLIDSARAHADEEHWAAACAAYSRAADLQPDHYLVWSGRGSLFLRLGLWKEAAADYARAMELGAPATNPGWWGVPLLFAFTGDQRHYREACSQLLVQMDKSQDPFSAFLILRSCLALPGTTTDPAELVNRTERLLVEPPSWPGGPKTFGGRPRPPRLEVLWEGGKRPGGGPEGLGRPPGPPRGMLWYPKQVSLYLAGLAHYRAGHYEHAVKRLREATQESGSFVKPMAQPMLAMAYFHAGKTTEARQMLALAAETIEEKTDDVLDSTVGYMPLPWFDWIESLILYREATLLLTGTNPLEDLGLQAMEQRARTVLQP